MDAITRHTWIQTYCGRRFDVANPQEKEICIRDIAIPLSRACRFGGHCIEFYSVAEHCVLAASMASPENQLTALMHDASEAYLVDVPRPIKHLLMGYKGLEDGIMRVLARKYSFQWPLPAEVTEIDTRILADERLQNMAHRPERGEEWGTTLPPLGVKLRHWIPEQAEKEFMIAFYKYGGKG